MGKQLLALLCVILQCIAMTSCQATRSFIDANANQQELMEKDIVVNLENAQWILHKTVTAKVIEQDQICKVQITSALGTMSRVEAFLLQDDYEGAMKQLNTVTNLLTECGTLLDASKAHQSQAVSYLIKQALAYTESAVNLLTLLLRQKGRLKGTYNPPVGTVGVTNVVPSTTCEVDGTLCQFSTCGRGKSLPICAIGFAAGVVGGANGQSYVVTDPLDDTTNPLPGTLRYGIGLGGTDTGVWITFAQNMTIHLRDMLWVRSMTTIDGRGHNVTITGRNIVLAGATNVILHNFQISSVGETDTIHIFSGSKKVWVDHVSSWDARLGLVSVLQGSTDITISNSFLTNPNFNMLLGASDADTEDKLMHVTVYRNWFKDSIQRMPHCRWGYCHVVNNLYTNWGYYAIGGRVHAKIVSESNVFIAGRRTEVTAWYYGSGPEFDATAAITSLNDLFLNGSTFHQSLGVQVSDSPVSDHNLPVHPTATLALLVEKCSGNLFGEALDRCMFVASKP